MLPELVRCLRCPHCTAPLTVDGSSLRCLEGHGYDVARQGYVNLAAATRSATDGDTPAMLDRRSAFLGAGHYAPILEGVDAAASHALEREQTGILVDVGAGPGWYLTGLLDRHPDRAGLAVDVARPAAQRAARAHPRIGAVVADVWGPIPVRSEAAACVLSIFAPRNPAEFRRMLAARGALVVVAPTSRHLAELVEPLGLVSVDPDKDHRLRTQLDGHFVTGHRERLAWELVLDHAAAAALVGMGPSAHHLDEEELRRRVRTLPEPVSVGAAVTITTFLPRR